MDDLVPVLYVIIAFLCTIGSIALAVFHIYRHLLNYTEPIYQRYIVRIIFMVPVYALMSFLSLILPSSSIYFDSIREVYEVWVIYNIAVTVSCLGWWPWCSRAEFKWQIPAAIVLSNDLLLSSNANRWVNILFLLLFVIFILLVSSVWFVDQMFGSHL